MVCAGCGQPLTAPSQRGRPARYHNATCRQRARRARLATHHGATLDTLTALEAAARDLRHAILTNQDTRTAHNQLSGAVAELARNLGTSPEPVAGGAFPSGQVTKNVTKPAPAEPRTLRATEPVARLTDEPATRATDAALPRVIKTVDLREQVGSGWTLIQYEGDTDAGVWHVHHDGRPMGTVCRAYDLTTNTNGWQARTAQYDHVPAVGALAASRRTDSLWRTRDSAVAGIAARAQRSRARTTRRRRSG